MSLLARQRWTFCGVQTAPGFAMLLVTRVEGHSTKALVWYSDDERIRIVVLQ